MILPQGPPAHLPDPLDPSRLPACPSDLAAHSPDPPIRPSAQAACSPHHRLSCPLVHGPRSPESLAHALNPPTRLAARLPPTHQWAHGSMSALGYWGCGGKMKACSAEVSGSWRSHESRLCRAMFNQGCASHNTLLGVWCFNQHCFQSAWRAAGVDDTHPVHLEADSTPLPCLPPLPLIYPHPPPR